MHAVIMRDATTAGHAMSHVTTVAHAWHVLHVDRTLQCCMTCSSEVDWPSTTFMQSTGMHGGSYNVVRHGGIEVPKHACRCLFEYG